MYDDRYDPVAVRAARRAVEVHHPSAMISLRVESGTKIVPLSASIAYASASPVLRCLAANIDCWPVLAAGLFVVEELTLHLRSTSAITVCHEAAQALDYALGGGLHLSGTDTRIRRAFTVREDS